jgi:hypothetical protein
MRGATFRPVDSCRLHGFGVLDMPRERPTEEGWHLSEPPDRYKRATSRKKSAPVKRVVLSAEAAKAYEKLVEDRDARDRDYARHLSADNKPK